MIVALWVTVLLVFARIGALLLTLPVFSASGVPKYVPVLTAVAITAVVAPGVPLVQAPGLIAIALALVSEIAVGLLAGLGVSAVFGAFQLGAELMSQQMGFAMLTVFDPLLDAQDSPLGILATWLAALVFIGAGLHLDFLLIVGESCHRVPPGQLVMHADAARGFAELVGGAIALGLQLSGPVVVMVFLINAFVGILTRLAPRMNVFFSLGLTVSSTAGVTLFALSLPWLLVAHHDAVKGTLRWAAALLLGG